MIALQIKEIKSFMGKLLGTECFDSFLLEEAVITTYNTFRIDGRINREFYSDEEWENKETHPDEFRASLLPYAGCPGNFRRKYEFKWKNLSFI